MIHARTHKSYVFQEYLGQFFSVCSFVGPQMTQSQNKKKITKFHIEAIADSLSQLIMSNGILVQLDYLTRHQ